MNEWLFGVARETQSRLQNSDSIRAFAMSFTLFEIFKYAHGGQRCLVEGEAASCCYFIGVSLSLARHTKQSFIHTHASKLF